MDTLDQYFVDNHTLALAVEVDVDVTGEASPFENLVLASYEDLIDEYFPA